MQRSKAEARERKTSNISYIVRVLVNLWIQGFFFFLISQFYYGLSIETFRSAIGLALFVGLFNALIWPTASRLLLPITVFTFGLASLFLNGLILYLASLLLPGVTIQLWWPVIWVSILLTILNTIISAIFSIDDDATYYRNVLKKNAAKNKFLKQTPGIVFLEIDGLAYPILKKALEEGFMPHLRQLAITEHLIKEWETDLSCQTGASQSGILHGDNSDIPAFRWVDKKHGGRIVTSSSVKDVPLIEERISNHKGLLSKNGGSRNNMFSGDANDYIMTLSKIKDVKKIYNPVYYGYFSSPYNFIRTIVLFVWEVLLEYRSRIRQKVRNIQPRLGREKRGGTYPFVRAATVVILQDVTAYSVISDIYSGENDTVYATFVGYDEVSHHCGVEDIDSLKTLTKIDKLFGRIIRASKESERPYRIVILSDHGQTVGATFLQRYSETIEDVIRRSMSSKQDIAITAQTETDEGYGHLSMALTDSLRGKDSISRKALRKLVRKNMYGDSVVMGPEKEYEESKHKKRGKNEVIVLASGNLGLIYFPAWKHRMTFEEINKEFPNTLIALAQHAGIGFVMVRSKKYGAIVIGKKGVYHLKSGRIEGTNPLMDFPENTPLHLSRTDSFSNAPDILINSMFDKKNNQVAAFEQLIGSHGGIGGYQSRPFIMYPKSFSYPSEKVVGAEKLHRVIKKWVV
jgi:uncharacterized membrane protein YvlD (DUF360 family)